METKICNQCRITRHLNEFHSDKRKKDGLATICKLCKRSYRISEKGIAATKRYNSSTKRKAVQDKYRKTPKGKNTTKKYYRSEKGIATGLAWKGSSAGKESISKYFRQNPSKAKAKNAMNWAIKSGKIPRASTLKCKQCGEPARHYHHHMGYSEDNKLDVIPLCILCHVKAHQTNSP